MKTAFLFPGQGAQSVGMGRDLYDTFPIARELFDRADAVLGRDLKRICFEGPDEELRKTENTQPAVLLVSYILAKLLEQEGIVPEASAGFSLGEYSALAAAGIIPFDEALTLVRARGLIIEKSYPAGKGGMAAVLGLDDKTVENICARFGDEVTAVNYNCPNQIVISGEKTALEKACALCDEAGAKRTMMLNVSGPFHSPLLKSGHDALAAEIGARTFAPLNGYKVLSNTTGDYHHDASLRDTLATHMHSPVYWKKCMERLFADGFDTFVEVGPGKVLSGFMKSIDRSRKCYSVSDATSLAETVKAIRGN